MVVDCYCVLPFISRKSLVTSRFLLIFLIRFVNVTFLVSEDDLAQGYR